MLEPICISGAVRCGEKKRKKTLQIDVCANVSVACVKTYSVQSSPPHPKSLPKEFQIIQTIETPQPGLINVDEMFG